ncbi:MAG: phosphoribosylaminoimidazolesuccinocarboxamide synthase [Nitrospinae bacterium]|nr:phosphoribosylaminoimidazolesuccinocarboxamide synthase [Nitrospinota bacterium]
MHQSNIKNAKLLNRGKVRDIYQHGENLLIIATDRISAFDYVMAETVPDKGKILNTLSAFWFDKFKNDVENHIITTKFDELPDDLKSEEDDIDGRFMYVKKAEPLKIEAIVRGYITGSGWKSYQKDGVICGIKLKEGMKESEKFPKPLYTPSTKADQGLHDENISFEETIDIVGKEIAEKVAELAISLYTKANDYAVTKGLILADTKLEFGLMEEKLILIDECFTPDSSRYWIKADYEPGKPQDPYDKQVLRNYLLSTDWDRNSPPPPVPQEIINKARSRYLEVYEILTGTQLL